MDRTIAGRGLTRFGPLLALGILQAVLGIVYGMLHAVPPEVASRILGVSMALYILYWILADARQRRCVPCFDFGFLLAVFFPLSLIWYAFWTRGWRGFLLLLAIALVIYGPSVVAAVVGAAVGVRI